MERIGTWPRFIAQVGRFLATDQPIEAMRRAGLVAEGAIAAALTRGKPARPFPPTVLANLTTEYGPPPPMRVFVGRARPPHDPPPSGLQSGYGLVATAELSVLNRVLIELWRVETIPHRLSQPQTQGVVTLRELREACTGVPDDAVLGRMQLLGPPVAVAGITSRAIRFEIPWLLPVVSATPARFAGTVSIDITLQFEVLSNDDRVGLSPVEGVEEASAIVRVDPSADIQPRFPLGQEILDRHFTDAVVTALQAQTFVTKTLTVPASRHISKTRFPNSAVTIVQAAGATVRASGRDFAVIGLNVENQHEVSLEQLATATVPGTPFTLHAVIDQRFASDALSTVITSGDLAAFFNRVIARHAGPFGLAPIRVDGGRISFHEGRLRMSLDIVWVEACAFGKNLAITATLTGTLSVADGKLTIVTPECDFDLDNTDALICSLLNAAFGPFSIILTAGVLAFIAALTVPVENTNTAASESSAPLPGSDKMVEMEFTRAAMTTGRLTADGSVSLVDDPIHVFAYLRVVADIGPRTIPVAGAKVDLFELDRPAPAGDDVIIPATGIFETIRPRSVKTVEVTYTPRADQHLGTKTTDDDGRVMFAAFSNMTGGILQRTTVVTDMQLNVISDNTTTTAVKEAKPDLAVSITSASGQRLATLRLVGLNVVNRRLGTFERPVVIRVPSVDAGNVI